MIQATLCRPMLVVVCIATLSLLIGCSMSEPRGAPPVNPGSDAEAQALSRLTHRAPSAAAASQLQEAVDRYTRSGRTVRDMAVLNTQLAATGLTSRVTVSSKPSGATVKFRLVGLSEVRTGNSLTNETKEILPIGIYHVWTEVNGKPTSSLDDRRTIVEKDVAIEIPQLTGGRGS